MKLIVLVSSNEFKASAGARIRYGRVAPELQPHGVDLAVRQVADFDPLADDYDAVLISKCHDARSLIVATTASDVGKLVGVDLFDDYFSDPADSRLSRYRSWLSQILSLCDFALCSTAVMASVITDYRPDIPIHQMNDPAPPHEFGALSSVIQRKVDLALEDMIVRVAWFGVGDNPYFQVGLADLASCAESLLGFERDGFTVDLTILTNKRALTADGLALIGQLPVAARIGEWTETAEQRLLASSLIAFLPVNAGAFSAAKSLNRAVTALSSGCQVLSVGNPLYAPLDTLIYRTAPELFADLVAGSLRFSSTSRSEYRRLIDGMASAPTEARRLSTFLSSLLRKQSSPQQLLRLIHGQTTRVEAHAMVRAAKGLSVASPYCSAVLDFDVLFRGAFPELDMLIARTAASRLLPSVRHQSSTEADYFIVPDVRSHFRNSARGKDWRLEPIPFQLATYSSAMAEMERRLTAAFGPGRTILSELSPFPFASVA